MSSYNCRGYTPGNWHGQAGEGIWVPAEHMWVNMIPVLLSYCPVPLNGKAASKMTWGIWIVLRCTALLLQTSLNNSKWFSS